MKDPGVVSFSPVYHFTGQKIRVHVLYCVLALMVARLMVREASQAGLHLPVRCLLNSLAGIEETVLFYQGERGRPRAGRPRQHDLPLGRPDRHRLITGVTNAAPESLNRLAKLKARMVYGFRNPANQR